MKVTRQFVSEWAWLCFNNILFTKTGSELFNFCLQKLKYVCTKTCTEVYSSSFHNWQKLKIIQMSINRLMHKLCYIHEMKIYLTIKVNYWYIQEKWMNLIGIQFSSVQFSLSVMSNSLQPHELQHIRPPYSSPTPGVYQNPCPLSRWCHPTISSSVIPFSSCPQSLPASGSFPMSQLITWGGQSIGVSASASVLPMNTQDWSPLGWIGWISLQSKGTLKSLSNTTVQMQQIFGAQLSSQSNSHIHTWPLEKP